MTPTKEITSIMKKFFAALIAALFALAIFAPSPAAAAGVPRLYNSGGSAKSIGYKTSSSSATTKLAPGTSTSSWASVYQFALPAYCPADLYRKKTGTAGGWAFHKRLAGTPATWTYFTFSTYAGSGNDLLVALDC